MFNHRATVDNHVVQDDVVGTTRVGCRSIQVFRLNINSICSSYAICGNRIGIAIDVIHLMLHMISVVVRYCLVHMEPHLTLREVEGVVGSWCLGFLRLHMVIPAEQGR